MNVRRLTEQDLPALLRIEETATNNSWGEKQLREELVHADADVFGVVDDAGALVGYVAVRAIAGEGWIMNIAVHRDARRRGIGRALLDVATAAAAKRRCPVVLLEVRASNEAALALYQSAGFTERGRRKNYYPQLGTAGEDGILWGKEMSDPFLERLEVS